MKEKALQCSTPNTPNVMVHSRSSKDSVDKTLTNPDKMKKKLYIVCFGATVLILIFVISCVRKPGIIPAKQYPVEEFFRNPDKVDFALSPDGKYFAYLAPYKSRLNIFIQEIGNTAPFLLTKDTTSNVSWFFWGNDKRILYLKDKAGDGYMKMFGIDINGINHVSLTDFDDVNTEVIDELADNDDYIMIGLNKRDPRFADPYLLNINSGELTLIEENPGNFIGWMTDHEGKIRLAIGDNDGIHYSVFFRNKEKDPFRTIYTTNPGETFSPQFFTSDNSKFIAISNVNRNNQAIVVFDPVTCEEDSILYINETYDIIQVKYSHYHKTPASAMFYSWKKEYHFFVPDYGSMYKNLESELGQKNIDIISSSKDESKRIIRASGDKSMGSYYLYDQETGKLNKIAEAKPWLDENEMADMVPVEYFSRDGLTIHSYITFPKGYNLENAKNLPVIINPYGGLWARDYWEFSPRVQFLANRGYVVFQMNFRGSTGYGKSFTLASIKQWGKAMQNDITEGVKWLISNKIADPARIAIYGASYGGYVTLAGITFTPELYAAAIDYCGISNIFTFLNSFPPSWKPYLEWYYDKIGNPKTDSLFLTEISPIFHVDSIRTPLLVIQGKNDNSVNILESNQIINTILNHDGAVEYIVKDNKGHIFRKEENMIEVYKKINEFLNKHLNKKE